MGCHRLTNPVPRGDIGPSQVSAPHCPSGEHSLCSSSTPHCILPLDTGHEPQCPREKDLQVQPCSVEVATSGVRAPSHAGPSDAITALVRSASLGWAALPLVQTSKGARLHPSCHRSDPSPRTELLVLGTSSAISSAGREKLAGGIGAREGAASPSSPPHLDSLCPP